MFSISGLDDCLSELEYQIVSIIIGQYLGINETVMYIFLVFKVINMYYIVKMLKYKTVHLMDKNSLLVH